VTAVLRAARAEDAGAIDALLRAAFGGDAEAIFVDTLRRDGDAMVELVAERDGCILGHVLFTEAPVGGTRAVCLAPLAVATHARRQGTGAALVQEGLARCAAAGAAAAHVLGDPAYYARFGFRRAEGITGAPWCDDPAFQVLSLAADRPPPKGAVRYARAFAAFGAG
jgi:putative acetyltransferase